MVMEFMELRIFVVFSVGECVGFEFLMLKVKGFELG